MKSLWILVLLVLGSQGSAQEEGGDRQDSYQDLVTMAEALRREGELRPALAVLKLAVEKSPERNEALGLTALVLCDLRDFGNALRALDLMKTKEEAGSHAALASLRAHIEARRRVNDLRQLKTEAHEAYSQGLFAKAANTFLAAWELEPGHPTLPFQAFHALTRIPDLPRASAVIHHLGSSPDPGTRQRAARRLARFRNSFETEYVAKRQLAVEQERTGELAAAMRTVADCMDLAPTAVEPHLMFGRLAVRRGDIPLAIDGVAHAIRLGYRDQSGLLSDPLFRTLHFDERYLTMLSDAFGEPCADRARKQNAAWVAGQFDIIRRAANENEWAQVNRLSSELVGRSDSPLVAFYRGASLWFLGNEAYARDVLSNLIHSGFQNRKAFEQYGLGNLYGILAQAVETTEVPGFERLPASPRNGTFYRHLRTGMVFVHLPGGTYQNPRPTPKTPTLSVRPYLLSLEEVSVSTWNRIMSDLPRPSPGDLPVTQVTHEEASRFCALVETTLPSRSQWEYAGLVGLNLLDGHLDTSRVPVETLKQEENLLNTGPRTPWPVHQGTADAAGIRNLLGNVSEWISPESSRNGLDAHMGFSFQRSLRTSKLFSFRVVQHGRSSPDVGFRLAFDL